MPEWAVLSVFPWKASVLRFLSFSLPCFAQTQQHMKEARPPGNTWESTKAECTGKWCRRSLRIINKHTWCEESCTWLSFREFCSLWCSQLQPLHWEVFVPLGISPGYKGKDGRPGEHNYWVRKAGILNSPPLEDQIAEDFVKNIKLWHFSLSKFCWAWRN